jgi:alpha-L-fucosidase 2
MLETGELGFLHAPGATAAAGPPPAGAAAAASPAVTPQGAPLAGAVATQSSTTDGGAAARAIDGNTDGNWYANSVTHTNLEPQPWWQVDLGSVRQIGSIEVWNRTDCCGNRLSNFYVLVSDTPFASADLAATLAQEGVSGYLTTGAGGTPTTLTVNRTGRYVRVQLQGTESLSLAEVRILP